MQNVGIELIMPPFPALFSASLRIGELFIKQLSDIAPLESVFLGKFVILLNLKTNEIVFLNGPCFTFGHCLMIMMGIEKTGRFLFCK